MELQADSRIPPGFPSRWAGRSRHPFPVPLKTFDESISVLRNSLDSASIDGGDKLEGFRRLDRFVRVVEERMRPEADLEAVVNHELKMSASLAGRSVLDDPPREKGQLKLF